MNPRLRELLFPSHPFEQVLRRLPLYVNMVSFGYFYYWWIVGECADFGGTIEYMLPAYQTALVTWPFALLLCFRPRPREPEYFGLAYLAMAGLLMLRVLMVGLIWDG
jgi:hypothetical protein